MDYELTVDIPTAGDVELLITGIGVVRNGTTIKVDTEQARQFKNLTGVTLGRANFQEGISARMARKGKASDEDTEEAGEGSEPPHPEDQPAPVQNAAGQTAKGDS